MAVPRRIWAVHPCHQLWALKSVLRSEPRDTIECRCCSSRLDVIRQATSCESRIGPIVLQPKIDTVTRGTCVTYPHANPRFVVYMIHDAAKVLICVYSSGLYCNCGWKGTSLQDNRLIAMVSQIYDIEIFRKDPNRVGV